MLNAWINKNDIILLLDESDSIDNFIDKWTFIQKLNRLKEHKKPKPAKKIKKSTVNHAMEIINDIIRYQNDVRFGYTINYFDKWLDDNSFIGLEDENHDGTFRKLFGDYLIETLKIQCNKDERYLKMNIIPKRDLEKIINVSRRTIQRWENKNFIERHVDYDIRFEYYNLEAIKKFLKSIKSDI